MVQKIYDELNSQQKHAVEHLEGPLLVLAGAGSGKTKVLTYRISHLLKKKNVRPNEILAVTFTNKAANEMKRRVEKLVGFNADGMWIGTFHSVCARILRIEAKHLGYDSNFTIYDVDDQVRLIKSIMEVFQFDPQQLKPRSVQYAISESKNKMKGPQEYQRDAIDFTKRRIAQIFWEYQKTLQKYNAFDFDDLLIKPLDIFTKDKSILEKYQNKFRYILVDEYQDTNKTQYYLIKRLSSSHRNICVVGDEDQSIYRWRGADIKNILSFEKDYDECEVVRLEQNYRSTQTILDAANSVVANNIKRLGKNLWSQKKAGDKIQVICAIDEGNEAERLVEIIKNGIIDKRLSYNDIAVLYRTNAQSRALEDKLYRNNIPYHIVGGTKFYNRKEVKDVLAYLRILVNPRDAVALKRIINYPARGIGAVSQNKIVDYATKQNMDLYSAILNVEKIDSLPEKVKNKIKQFVTNLESFRSQLEEASAYQIAREVDQVFGLSKQYSHSLTPEDESRLENINELLNSVASFTEKQEPAESTLAKYLEDVALLTGIDRWDPSYAAVTLMTLHSAKGLEFPTIIITGLEDGLFPLFQSIGNDDDLEEERRLFYVGLTRAMDNLHLLWAKQRRRFSRGESGMSFRCSISRFLKEIPRKYLDEKQAASSKYSYQRQMNIDNPDNGHVQKTANSTLNASTNSQYKIGDWVQHLNFGKGQILSIQNTTAGTKLTVLFNKKLKKLIAEYADIRVLKKG